MYSNIKRIYTKELLNPKSHIIFIGKKHHYLKNVMRVENNDLIRLFNGRQGEWLCKIIKVDKKNIQIQIEKKLLVQNNSSDIWLFFAALKQDRINILIQKCTELGLSRFIPIKTERTNIKNINIKNLKENAIAASEQSERLDIPIISDIISINLLNEFFSDDRCILYCDEKDLKCNNIVSVVTKYKKKFNKWSVIVGPEGGFSASERKTILNLQNVYPVSLGRRILRSDTAAPAAIFCLQQIIEN